MKTKFKYEEKTPGKLIVYSRTALTRWRWIGLCSYSTEKQTADQAFCEYVKSLPKSVSFKMVLGMWWAAIMYVVRQLKFWYFPSMPGQIYNHAKQYFKKLPWKLSVKHWVPDLDDEYRRLHWYNLIHLYISDVDYKYKWHDYVFTQSPTIALTFCGKWSIMLQQTIGLLDDLYWEEMLNFIYNGKKVEHLGNRRLYSSFNPSDIYTIDSYLKTQSK